MSLCPLCGRAMCNHSPQERDQTFEEMNRQLTAEEQAVWRSEPDGSPKLIKLAQKNAHLSQCKMKGCYGTIDFNRSTPLLAGIGFNAKKVETFPCTECGRLHDGAGNPVALAGWGAPFIKDGKVVSTVCKDTDCNGQPCCAGIIDFSQMVMLRVGCQCSGDFHIKAHPCNICGRLHDSDGDVLRRGDGRRGFLVGGEVVLRD